MSTIPRTQTTANVTAADPVAALEQRQIALGGPQSRSLTRHQIAGHVVLTWAVAYAALRPWSPVLEACGQATLVTAVWTLIGHSATQAFRTMTFAVGSTAVAAATSACGVATISGLSFWFSWLDIDRLPLALIAFGTIVVSRGWDYIVHRTAQVPRRVLVVGGGPATARLLDDLSRAPDALMKVIAIVDDSLDDSIDPKVPYGGPLHELPDTIQRLSPDLVVVAVERGRPEVFAQLLRVAGEGFQVAGIPEIYEFTFGRLPIEDLTSAWFMSVLHAYNRTTNRLAKRAFDIVMALIGIVVALPLVPFIIVLVKLTPGPILYRQRRLGEHGRPFTILKFRSMRQDAEASGQALWAAKDDPRITRSGKLMRKLRFDEIPQLWNVLVGEMSIVGPRPERPEFIDHLEAEVPFWTQRHLLKPGITGWAQISAGYAADALGTAEKLSYDLWYLRHRSLVLDAMICLKTIPRMATFRGAR